MYILSHGNVPKLIQNLYQSNNNVHTHLTRHAHHLHTMRGNNDFIYITFAFQRVLIWNKVLQNIHVSYTRFKHILKDFLLSNVIAFSGVLLLLHIITSTYYVLSPYDFPSHSCYEK